jgi:hypothetical protein
MDGSADRVAIPAVCIEYRRATGRQCEASGSQIRTWAVDGLLEDLGAERSASGRWSLLRAKLPLLEQLAPRLIARSESRMRHEHRKIVAARRRGTAEVSA